MSDFDGWKADYIRTNKAKGLSGYCWEYLNEGYCPGCSYKHSYPPHWSQQQRAQHARLAEVMEASLCYDGVQWCEWCEQVEEDCDCPECGKCYRKKRVDDVCGRCGCCHPCCQCGSGEDVEETEEDEGEQEECKGKVEDSEGEEAEGEEEEEEEAEGDGESGPGGNGEEARPHAAAEEARGVKREASSAPEPQPDSKRMA